MTSRISQLTFDCADPHTLAEFWCAVLDFVVLGSDEEGVKIGPSDPNQNKSSLPELLFLRVPEGKTVKNRLHLDINPVGIDQADEVSRLLELGARRVDISQGEVSWVVLAGIEGNEFCVLSGRH